MKPTIPALFVTVWTVMSSSALAAEDLRGEIYCYPAKDVPRLVEKLDEIDEKRRDVVNVRLEPRFIIKDGGGWPDRFYLAKDGEIVTDMPFSREDGTVPNFIEATKARPDTDICIDDPSRADRPADDEGLYFEMGLAPLFHNKTGQHTLAELQEGAKDGKKFYKKMLPSTVAFFMPDTDHFAVRMDMLDVMPKVFALTRSGERPLTLEMVKDMWVVSLDEIESLEAVGMVVRGGEYALQPVPSAKMLRRFGWDDATNKE